MSRGRIFTILPEQMSHQDRSERCMSKTPDYAACCSSKYKPLLIKTHLNDSSQHAPCTASIRLAHVSSKNTAGMSVHMSNSETVMSCSISGNTSVYHALQLRQCKCPDLSFFPSTEGRLIGSGGRAGRGGDGNRVG